MRLAPLFAPIAIALALASTVSATDLVVTQRSSAGIVGTTASEETVYIADDRIVTDAPAMRTIVDLARKTITTADKTKRTYTVLTFDELNAQMESLRKAMDKLPPEARKQMGALFDEGAAVSVTPTGRTETIAGYSAREHALRGGPYSGVVWTTDAIATPAAFKKWKGLEQARGGAANRLGEAMKNLEGFPLRTRIEVKGGAQAMVLSNEVLAVRDGGAPAEVVRVPAGFTRRELPGTDTTSR